jgi:transposase
MRPAPACGSLSARRADKSADRVRAINRLQAQLLEYFPALERAFDYSRSKAALLLLTKHGTPGGIRRTGQARLHAWLKKHGTRSSAAVAQAAIDAAKSQQTTVPAQHLGELIFAALAREIITLNEELAELDALISEKVTEHRHTKVLLSMPGFGPVLAAEFLGATGGDLTVFQSADRFAGVADLAPAPRDSGRISGNHHRPRRYDRRLLRVFYLSGLSALNPVLPRAAIMTANAARAKPTSRPCSPSPDAGSTSCGPCSATAPSTPRSRRRHGHLQLDARNQRRLELRDVH